MMNIFQYILPCIFLIGFLFYLKSKTKENSKMGINLNDVYCPVCNEKQPKVRLPKNINQFLYGGNACDNCKTEMDKYEKIISPKK